MAAEHPVFTVAMWKSEVANDDTRQGYTTWVELLKEWAAAHEAALSDMYITKP